MVPADVLAAAGLNAEMRAIAERAASGVEQRSARPPVAIDPAEVAEDGAAQIDAAETAADALGIPKVVPPPAYQPIAPFGLTFTFNTQTGGYAGVTMSDATFWWNDAGTLTEKTASVGQLSLTGTVYLNVTLDAQGKYASAAVGMSASGDLSLKLYQLDQNGVVKDYRHALVVLGIGGKVDLDGKSLDTVPDAEQGATPTGDEGKAEIKNWHAATQPENKSTTKLSEDLIAATEADNQILVREANGTLKYKSVGILPLDNASLEIDASGSQRKMQIKGFAAANAGTLPVKNVQGGLTWNGKAITSISSTPSTEPGGTSTLTLTLSDGTTETISVTNGTNGTSPTVSVSQLSATTAHPNGGWRITINGSNYDVWNGNNAIANLDKEFQLGGVKVADIAASANINVTQKTITGDTASGIVVSEANGVITISFNGGAGGTTGYTGTRYTLKETRYDAEAHKLQMKRYTETWTDGVMTDSVEGSWEDFSAGALAVQETV